MPARPRDCVDAIPSRRSVHGAGQEVKRGASRMEIEKGVAARKDFVRDKFGNLLRDGTQRISWKGPVEVQAIDRRGAGTGNDGMDIVGRHQDQTSLHRALVNLAHEIANSDWSLIFVAIITAFHHYGQPTTRAD